MARLLREGRRAKDYSKLLGYLRSLAPSKLDAELRDMQVPLPPCLMHRNCAPARMQSWTFAVFEGPNACIVTSLTLWDARDLCLNMWVSMYVQLIPGVSSKEQLQDMCRLLDFLAVELASNRNFEFLQALLRLTLQVHP